MSILCSIRMHLNFSNQIRINHATSKSFNTFAIHPDPDDLRVLLLGRWQVCVGTLMVALRNSSGAHLLRNLFRGFPRLYIYNDINNPSFLHGQLKEKSYLHSHSPWLSYLRMESQTCQESDSEVFSLSRHFCRRPRFWLRRPFPETEPQN
jgi:hypothetical protein